MCIEDEIAKYMITVSKFEFYLINRNIKLAHIPDKNNLQKIMGINWEVLANLIEKGHPFSNFDFKRWSFLTFKDNPPQFLVKCPHTCKPKWDSDVVDIDSWSKLLTRGFAQLRNNIAHGNKGQLPAPFTKDRTLEFIDAGYELIKFITKEIFGDEYWESKIVFKN